MSSSREQLLARLSKMPVIDTHEHFTPEIYLNGSDDFFTLLSPYVVDVLTAAGMPVGEWAATQNKSLPLETRWNILAPYLPLVRHTRVFRVVDRVVRERYGLRAYDAEEIARISPLIAADGTKEGYFRLCREADIRATMTFLSFDCHRLMGDSVMIPVPTVSDIHFKDLRMLTKLTEVTGVPIASFDSLLAAVDKLFSDYRAAGIRAIKFGSAYGRRLDYQPTPRAEAERVFTEVLRTPGYGDTMMCGACPNGFSDDFLRPLDDFLAFYMVGKAGENGMNVFFHCGIHAWNRNDPDAAKVSGLRTLIDLHPHVHFTLLHVGYPYVDDAILLAKYYPNVTLNLTWLPVLDRVKTVELIRRLVELLPVNKVEGFGGDYCTLSLAAEHLRLSREDAAEALADYIDRGEMTIDEAAAVARAWYYDNPVSNYRLEVSEHE